MVVDNLLSTMITTLMSSEIDRLPIALNDAANGLGCIKILTMWSNSRLSYSNHLLNGHTERGIDVDVKKVGKWKNIDLLYHTISYSRWPNILTLGVGAALAWDTLYTEHSKDIKKARRKKRYEEIF